MSSFLQSKEKLLWNAAENGDVSLMENYLAAGTDVNYKNPNKVIRNNIGQFFHHEKHFS